MRNSVLMVFKDLTMKRCSTRDSKAPLSYGNTRGLKGFYMNVKSTFLNNDPIEEVYGEQLLGYEKKR